MCPNFPVAAMEMQTHPSFGMTYKRRSKEKPWLKCNNHRLDWAITLTPKCGRRMKKAGLATCKQSMKNSYRTPKMV